MNWFNWLTKILVIIGALNWGLVGFFDWDLVMAIFSSGMGSTIIYAIVGLAGLWELIKLFKK